MARPGPNSPGRVPLLAQLGLLFNKSGVSTWKEREKEGRKVGRREGGKEGGRKEERKEGRKERRKEGTKSRNNACGPPKRPPQPTASV